MRTLLLSILLAAQACYGGYTYSRPVTVDHTKVPNTNQTNLTVLVSGTYSYLAVVGSGGEVQSGSGYDVAFGSTVGCTSLLNWEQETWTSTTGVVNYWVLIPTLSHTVDTVFYVCTGNASIVSFQGGAQGSAWNSTAALYHFPNGSSLSAADSSSNNRTLTINAATAVAGQIDGATGTTTSKYLHDDSLAPTPLPITTITFSLWVKTTFASNSPYATYGRDTGANQIVLYNLTPKAYVGASGGGITSTTTVNDGNYHFIAAVVDNSNGANNTHLYVDGALEVTGSVTWNISIGSPTDNLTVGLLGGGSQPFTGSIDEVHIQSTNRSADWIATEYNSQSSPSTFYAIGPQVVSGGVRHRVISQ